MRVKNNKKLIIYGVVFVLIVITVAYAALATSLNIIGQGKVSAKWSIYFTNVSNPTLTGKAKMNKPTLNSSTNLSFSAILQQPLDKVVFTVDIVNDGTFDAYIENVNLSVANAEGDTDDISYSVTYADDSIINKGDSLLINQIRTLKVTIQYNEVNIDGMYTWDSGSLDLQLNLTYYQGTGNGSGGGIYNETIAKDTSGASEPALLNHSLIPVVYDETANDGEGSWRVADITKPWYNYEEQIWANAVILNDDVSVVTGTVIDVEEDAKAMYVWIPRYEYKIEGTYGTHTDGTPGTQALPGEIEVKFISSTQTTADSGYILHPAFTWDNNDDGSISADEHLTGIWVGKFETTGSASVPTILPNKKSLIGLVISAKFTTAQVFGTYLTNSANVDAHMMKNSEWGAVVYLSQSIYGKYGNSMYTGANKEIYKNNSSYIYTGRSSGIPPASGASTNGTCSYNDITDRGSGTGSCGGGASTTGNIYGIYDMSSGTEEYVMGYLTVANSNYATDPDSYFGWTSSSNNAGFSFKLADKYFDAYTSEDFATACNGGVCYGHALSETPAWYEDLMQAANAIRPWIFRGGHTSTNKNGGVFYSYYGSGSSAYTFRSVLLATGA